MKQHEKILGYIDEFGSITPMEAFADHKALHKDR